MVRRKTSIYIDDRIWKEFEEYAVLRELNVSDAIEDVLNGEMLKGFEEAIGELTGPEDYQLDFKLVKPREPVSTLIREMRNERAENISR
jgi:hypothetical protein